jgi:hypothetical protein
MKTPGRPRIGQTIANVSSKGGGLVAEMTLWLQQYLSLVGRNPVTTVVAQAVGASPFVFQNTGDFDVDAAVTGGTVSAVAFSRDGATFLTVASATNTTVRLNPGDSIRITYTVLPTLTMIPR